ncbi:MAG: hypothetical protein AABW80_04145 [Nanoarchaeota archaeon]
MKLSKLNICLLLLFFLVFSVYATTGIHEIGHGMSAVYYGCSFSMSYVGFPLPIGITFCEGNDAFFDSLPIKQINWIYIFGPLLVSLFGIILLFFFHIDRIRNDLVLSPLVYFLAFFSLANGFLQSIKSSDLFGLVHNGFNPMYSYIFAIILFLIIIYSIFIFKYVKEAMFSGFSKKEKKMVNILWVAFIIFYFAVYFLLFEII